MSVTESHVARASSTGPRRGYMVVAYFIKTLIDVLGSSAVLLFLLPLMAFVGLLVFLDMGRPVLFRQWRAGRNGRLFQIVKFRTMRPPREGEVWYRSDERRLTKLGGFLRRTSIDELPELWNVIRGEMSIVGPRPLLPQYLEKYTPEQMRRHNVLPGITGWAQVNGRQGIPFSKRLELDTWYVDHWSLLLDMQIVLMTLRQAVSGTDVILGQNVDDVDDLGLSSAVPGRRSVDGTP